MSVFVHFTRSCFTGCGSLAEGVEQQVGVASLQSGQPPEQTSLVSAIVVLGVETVIRDFPPVDDRLVPVGQLQYRSPETFGALAVAGPRARSIGEYERSPGVPGCPKVFRYRLSCHNEGSSGRISGSEAARSIGRARWRASPPGSPPPRAGAARRGSEPHCAAFRGRFRTRCWNAAPIRAAEELAREARSAGGGGARPPATSSRPSIPEPVGASGDWTGFGLAGPCAGDLMTSLP